MDKCNNELGELKGIIFIDTQRQQFDLKYPKAINLDAETYNEFLHKYRRVLKIKRLLEKAKEDLKTIKYYI